MLSWWRKLFFICCKVNSSVLHFAQYVLIVDECRSTGSQSEAFMTLFTEKSNQPTARLAAKDSFIPTGPAYGTTMPSRDDIVNAALALVKSQIKE